MRITGVGNFPAHAAKAYGVAAPIAAPTHRGTAIDVLTQTKSADATNATTAVQRLVAGKVSQPVSFDPPGSPMPRPAQANGNFQLYTRAADKIEAAGAVQIGRAIDLTG